MVLKLYIHGLKSGNEYYVTLESSIALFLYQTLENLNDFELHFINQPIEIELIKISISIDNLNIIYHDKLEDAPILSKTCKLPLVHCVNTNSIIAGLCAVCRCLIKTSLNENLNSSFLKKLLGFKSGCLLSPTETSNWTKFCEIDIINCINVIYKNLSYDIVLLEYKLPSEIGMFECHLSNPVRAHNVYKLARDLANNQNNLENMNINKDNTAVNIKKVPDGEKEKKHPDIWVPRINKKKVKKIADGNLKPINELQLEHKFCEGEQITIADLILFVSFYFILKKLEKFNLNKLSIPYILKWFNNVKSFDDNKFNNIFINLFKPFIKGQCLHKSEILITIDKIKNFTLYSDKKNFSSQITNVFTKENDIKNSLEIFTTLNIDPSLKRFDTLGKLVGFNWDEIPLIAQPENGNLPSKRLLRKKYQLENMAQECVALARDNDRIVDFCSGTGHLGILLASKLPNCTIYLVENKEQSLTIAKERIKELNLKNLYFYQSNLDYFIGNFEIGLSLHACGIATDIVLDICQQRSAKFIAAPCCYGKIHEMPHIKYPRSKIYRTVLNYTDYLYIAHCADQTHDIETKNVNIEKSIQGELCMDITDMDRKLAAEELNYNVIITKMIPENCSLKNRMLIGVLDRQIKN